MHAVGWICAIFSVCVFAAPLNIMTCYTNKECRIHAILAFFLPHAMRGLLVEIWSCCQGSLYCFAKYTRILVRDSADDTIHDIQEEKE
ncbi:hypothetical protein M5689_011530 [Euphorbia peplus]|nr:hypothetical protein M5689_011530 [Euphorbia peplus]